MGGRAHLAQQHRLRLGLGHYLDLVTGGGGNGTLIGFVGDACCGLASGTRKMLAGATVSLSGTSYSGKTDPSGTYTISIPAGTYRPGATFNGYDAGDHTSLGEGYPAALAVTAGGTTWGSILLHPKAPIIVAAGVQGQVTSAVGPLANAGVSLAPGGAHTVTAADGSYAIPAAAGSYTLSADAQGFQPLAQSVTVTTVKPVTVDLTLQKITEGSPPPLPRIRLDSPDEGSTVDGDSVLVSGVAEVPDLKTLNINDEQVDFDTAGVFGVVVPLKLGPNDLIVTATGHSGATVTTTVHVESAPVALSRTGCSSAAPADLVAILMLGLLAPRRKRPGSQGRPGARWRRSRGTASLLEQ